MTNSSTRILVWLGSLFLGIGCGSDSSGGKNKSGAGPASEPGCTTAPACGSCTVCYDACVCQTGDSTKCANACAGSGPVGTGGMFGAGGSGMFGAGGGGTFGAGGAGTLGSGGTSIGGVPGAGGDLGAGGSAGPVVFPPGSGGCGQALPPTGDYGAMGPFPTTTVNNTGPDGNYTVIRPTTLGENGFKHPPTMWGNGITTTPAAYVGLLGTIASNGFVVVASNSTNVTTQLMNAGIDWLVAQNDAPGDFQGKLNPACLVSIGYSLGGGAAVGAGSHANVVTTVSFHGLTGNSAALHGPLLLFTSKQDTFVSAAQFVDPTFNASTVQTFYATLVGAGDAGHYTPINTGGPERAPAVAWLRLWVYGDQAARQYFDGADCILCKDPWTNPQTKNWH